MQEKFYTIQEVANYLRVSYSTVYRLINKGKGKLRAHQVGSKWRITQGQIDEYLKGGADDPSPLP